MKGPLDILHNEVRPILQPSLVEVVVEVVVVIVVEVVVVVVVVVVCVVVVVVVDVVVVVEVVVDVVVVDDGINVVVVTVVVVEALVDVACKVVEVVGVLPGHCLCTTTKSEVDMACVSGFVVVTGSEVVLGGTTSGSIGSSSSWLTFSSVAARNERSSFLFTSLNEWLSLSEYALERSSLFPSRKFGFWLEFSDPISS